MAGFVIIVFDQTTQHPGGMTSMNMRGISQYQAYFESVPVKSPVGEEGHPNFSTEEGC